MRKIWKICYMALALLPLLPIIVYAVGNVGADTGIQFEPFPVVTVAQDGTISTDGTGMYSTYIDTFNEQMPATGLQRAVGRMLYWVQTNCGYVITSPIVIAVWYMLYVGFVGILLALMAVVFFIPNAIERWMKAW